MLRILREFVKSLPTLILSFALAVAVWISSVTAADPVQQRLYPRPVTIEIQNQSPSLVISNDIPTQATVTLNAPTSVWDEMLNARTPIRAYLNLAGLDAGTHVLDVDIQVQHQPVRVVSQNPDQIEVVLERLVSQEFPINLERRGEPAIGFQMETPSLSQNTVTISGPASQVDNVSIVRVVLEMDQASDSINRVLDVQVLDSNEIPVEGVTVVPDQVTIDQPITQLGGYKSNVVVKVVTTGQRPVGYRLTNVSVSPPTVTVFSNNPELIENLPGFVETSPLDLTGVRDDFEVRLPLNLPEGVSVVGDQSVVVQVGMAAIEDSVTLSGLPVEVSGLPPELAATVSPTTVDVIVSGPVLLLDRLTPQDVNVIVDLTSVSAGTYQFAPRVTLDIPELQVESILPSSIEVVVEAAPTPTPTPRGGR